MAFLDDYRNGKIELPVAIENDAGKIQNLREGECGGVSIITTRAGAIRSNHYHKHDAHLLYIVSGDVLYFERPIGEVTIPEPVRFVTGEMIYTGPMVEHATWFLTDTVMVSISARSRDKESHEEDVVRVDLLTKANMKSVFIQYLNRVWDKLR